MTKSIKALLAQQAAANLQEHRQADYMDAFDVGRQHTKIPINKIVPNPFQPRLVFSEDSIRDLAESIAKIGLTQPVTVRARGETFELIAGERRLRAHSLLNKPTIEAIVVDVDDGQALAMALSENIDREGLTDFEVAEGMRQLEENFPKRSHMAKALNLARSELYRYLAFHELPELVIARLRQKPDLIGRRAASEMAQVLKNNPVAAARLEEALTSLEQGRLEQGQLAAFLSSPVPENKPKTENKQQVPLLRGQERVGSLSYTKNDVVIKIAQQALSAEQTVRLQDFLQELLTS